MTEPMILRMTSGQVEQTEDEMSAFNDELADEALDWEETTFCPNCGCCRPRA